VGAVPARRPARTPAAQPTPARTVIAPGSQFRAHAPHSMHAPAIGQHGPLVLHPKTACGQTRTQRLQPLHRGRVEFQCDHAFEVPHAAIPPPTKRPVSHNPKPTPAAAIWAGTAKRISRSTPLRDVTSRRP